MLSINVDGKKVERCVRNAHRMWRAERVLPLKPPKPPLGNCQSSKCNFIVVLRVHFVRIDMPYDALRQDECAETRDWVKSLCVKGDDGRAIHVCSTFCRSESNLTIDDGLKYCRMGPNADVPELFTPPDVKDTGHPEWLWPLVVTTGDTDDGDNDEDERLLNDDVVYWCPGHRRFHVCNNQCTQRITVVDKVVCVLSRRLLAMVTPAAFDSQLNTTMPRGNGRYRSGGRRGGNRSKRGRFGTLAGEGQSGDGAPDDYGDNNDGGGGGGDDDDDDAGRDVSMTDDGALTSSFGDTVYRVTSLESETLHDVSRSGGGGGGEPPDIAEDDFIAAEQATLTRLRQCDSFTTATTTTDRVFEERAANRADDFFRYLPPYLNNQTDPCFFPPDGVQETAERFLFACALIDDMLFSERRAEVEDRRVERTQVDQRRLLDKMVGRRRVGNPLTLFDVLSNNRHTMTRQHSSSFSFTDDGPERLVRYYALRCLELFHGLYVVLEAHYHADVDVATQHGQGKLVYTAIKGLRTLRFDAFVPIVLMQSFYGLKLSDVDTTVLPRDPTMRLTPESSLLSLFNASEKYCTKGETFLHGTLRYLKEIRSGLDAVSATELRPCELYERTHSVITRFMVARYRRFSWPLPTVMSIMIEPVCNLTDFNGQVWHPSYYEPSLCTLELDTRIKRRSARSNNTPVNLKAAKEAAERLKRMEEARARGSGGKTRKSQGSLRITPVSSASSASVSTISRRRSRQSTRKTKMPK